MKFKVKIDKEQPDFIFFSSFGIEHLKYRCPRVFFCTENERPNMFKSDLAITMDYNDSNRHFRLPLFVYYMNQYKITVGDLNYKKKEEIIGSWRSKSKFCCAVISNSNSKLRNEFLEFLQSKEQIDSGGRFLNNVGGPVEDKLEFIREYKFVISFENSKYIGYTTEKILEPLIVGSIPIYWGNPLVNKDFNTASFLNVRNRSDFERIYSLMKKIESNEELALTYLHGPKLLDNDFLDNKSLLDFVENIFTLPQKSQSKMNIRLAKFVDARNELLSKVRYRLGLNFR